MTIPLFLKALSAYTDNELMQRIAQKGDDKAFDELYRRHVRRLIGFFFRQMNRDEALAADLVQDTFLKVWTNRERWKSGDEFIPWLFTIAYNICKNEYRHQNYQAEYEEETRLTGIEEMTNDLDKRIDDSIFDQMLKTALSRMTPETRILFSLRFEEELQVAQIAEVMGIPEGTVKSRLNTLTNKLKDKFKNYGNI